MGYAFLNRKIAPITLSIKEARQLIDDLGSDDDKVWKAAQLRLYRRDIRLAVNFLDAWDYTKSGLQRQRLASIVFLQIEFPHFYDATLVQNAIRPNEPPTHRLSLTLSPTVPKELILRFGLGVGHTIDLDDLMLAVPDPGGYLAEVSVVRYLANTRSAEADALIDRLAKGIRVPKRRSWRPPQSSPGSRSHCPISRDRFRAILCQICGRIVSIRIARIHSRRKCC